MSASFDVVAAKAFGDLIIALSCTAGSGVDKGSRLLLGSHLLPLCEAIGSSLPVVVLEHGESGVPSLYDVRKNGWPRAARSALALRASLRQASSDNTLMFDRMGWRERFVAGARPALALPDEDNIYLAYRRVFGSGGAAFDPRPAFSRRLGIFPGSRLPKKCLPLELIADIERAIEASGGVAELILLDGERPDLERDRPEAQKVPRSFAAMAKAVRGCDAVVSADSMPAHMAEAFGRPVFVFTPVANSYWMPYSAFAERRWALFSDGAARGMAAFLDLMELD